MSARLSHPAALLALLFAVAIAIGTVLLLLPWAHADGSGTDLVTAIFTATSAVCVTGLAVVDTGTHWSMFGQVTILVLFQLGGFGMMASASVLALLIGRRIGLRSRLALQAETHSLALADVRSLALLILVVTVVVEGLTTLCLALRFAITYGMAWTDALWHGLFHAVS
ncbi:MAG: potassium transporter TrkG, partial [Rubrivivax sp.]